MITKSQLESVVRKHENSTNVVHYNMKKWSTKCMQGWGGIPVNILVVIVPARQAGRQAAQREQWHYCNSYCHSQSVSGCGCGWVIIQGLRLYRKQRSNQPQESHDGWLTLCPGRVCVWGSSSSFSSNHYWGKHFVRPHLTPYIPLRPSTPIPPFFNLHTDRGRRETVLKVTHNLSIHPVSSDCSAALFMIPLLSSLSSLFITLFSQPSFAALCLLTPYTRSLDVSFFTFSIIVSSPLSLLSISPLIPLSLFSLTSSTVKKKLGHAASLFTSPLSHFKPAGIKKKKDEKTQKQNKKIPGDHKCCLLNS